MKIINYSEPTSYLQQSMRDLLESAFQGRSFETWTPALDVYEDEDKFTVTLEAAGVAPDAFEISLDDDVLTISGERKQETSESLRNERFFGKFKRSIHIPSPVKGDETHASYVDGVLTVELPKREEAKPKKITVNLN